MENNTKATETATFPRMNITICIDFGNGMKVSQPVDVTVNQQPVTAAPPSAETTETAEEQQPIEAAPVAAIETENETETKAEEQQPPAVAVETADEIPKTEEEKEPTPAELEDALPENRPPVKLHVSPLRFAEGVRVKYSGSRKIRYYSSVVDLYRSFVGASVDTKRPHNPLNLAKDGLTYAQAIVVLKRKLQKLVDKYWPGVKVQSITRYGRDGVPYTA